MVPSLRSTSGEAFPASSLVTTDARSPFALCSEPESLSVGGDPSRCRTNMFQSQLFCVGTSTMMVDIKTPERGRLLLEAGDEVSWRLLTFLIISR